MTDVIARSPLHPFPMASVQRSARRRSARLETEDDARPAKKQKLDDGGAPLKTPGRKHAANSKKSAACMSPEGTERIECDDALGADAMAAYTEDADGFQFARKKVTRKAPAKEKTAEAAQPASGEMSAQAGAQQTDTSNERPAQPAKKRKRRFSEAIREEGARPRRRSARLSGEKVQPVPPDDSKPTPATPQVGREGAVVRAEVTEPEGDEAGLRVEKRRVTTKIALPFADTPVITRNKEMRKNSGGHRRSSTGLRGRRASSLIESGTSNGMFFLGPFRLLAGMLHTI